MRRFGIRRHRNQSERMRGKVSAWNNKTETHYDRLFHDLRLEGLWRWHTVAMHLRAAQVPMHTGTIPAERFWAYLQKLLPSSARSISYETFMLMSQIAFLQYNYHLYNTGCLPKWCRKDSFLAQRLDGLATCARLLDNNPGTSHGVLELLYAPFSD